jgi:hypothetical protein
MVHRLKHSTSYLNNALFRECMSAIRLSSLLSPSAAAEPDLGAGGASLFVGLEPSAAFIRMFLLVALPAFFAFASSKTLVYMERLVLVRVDAAPAPQPAFPAVPSL